MIYEWIVRTLLAEETIWTQQLRKRTIIIDESGDAQYKGSIAVDFFNDKIDLITVLRTGDAVKVWLNFKSREYNGKRYNSISGWKIEKANANGSATDTSSGQANDEDLFPF